MGQLRGKRWAGNRQEGLRGLRGGMSRLNGREER